MKSYVKILLFPFVVFLVITFLCTQKLFFPDWIIAKYLYLFGGVSNRITFIDTMGISFLITFLIILFILKFIGFFIQDINILKGLKVSVLILILLSILSFLLTVYVWFF